jgi:hypothetical protein
MKKTDIAMIVLIASISMGLAYAVAQAIPFFKLDDNGVKVKTIESISASVEDPDPELFSDNAINPTVKIVIGNSEE